MSSGFGLMATVTPGGGVADGARRCRRARQLHPQPSSTRHRHPDLHPPLPHQRRHPHPPLPHLHPIPPLPPRRLLSGKVCTFFSRPAARPAAPSGAPAAAAQPDVHCPGVEVRQGTSTMTLSSMGSDPSALALRYQATVGRTARECVVRGDALTIRVGMEGRIILGPAGGPAEWRSPFATQWSWKGLSQGRS